MARRPCPGLRQAIHELVAASAGVQRQQGEVEDIDGAIPIEVRARIEDFGAGSRGECLAEQIGVGLAYHTIAIRVTFEECPEAALRLVYSDAHPRPTVAQRGLASNHNIIAITSRGF